MKLLLSLLCSLFLLSNQTTAQILNINFESQNWQNYISIDTVNNPNNSWEVGSINKTTISSAHSLPNAIVTDTLLTYPINDSSVFAINHLNGFGILANHTFLLGGYYNVDTDSLNDYGKIELSLDNGANWYNIKDSLIQDSILWGSRKPVLSGNSGGWQYFSANLASLGYLNPSISFGDTVLFRFTFISDSIVDSLDGIAFDGIMLYDYAEGLNDAKRSDFSSNCYPNPANNKISIETNEGLSNRVELLMTDNQGKLIRRERMNAEDLKKIDVSNLSTGNYHYQLVDLDKRQRSYGQFVVQH